MNRNESSLLMLFEDNAVNKAGRVSHETMNEEDREIAERWNEEGYVEYGRIKHSDIHSNEGRTRFAVLSDNAWADASREREARAKRINDRQPFPYDKKVTGESNVCP